jgi:flavin reductase (DIM6/NTAB) family NADH-FMN oxidoreductase RutF
LPVDKYEFRSVIGHFASGVTVITSADGETLHGMTANAISSLSLDPVLLLICVDKTAHSYQAIQNGGAFVVHVLGEHQETMSRLFAKHEDSPTGTLRGQAFRRGQTGTPILTDCLAYLECRVVEMLDGGDHSIFLGEVVDEAVVNPDAAPLIFYRGGYRSLDG